MTDAVRTQGAEATWTRLRAALEGVAWREGAARDAIPAVELDREALRAALERLRDLAGFEQMTLVTAVDHLDEEAAVPREPRFTLVHQLLSCAHGDRVRLRTGLASDDARAPGCSDLFPGASFMERECYDMFGIHFDGHPDLRRLLMPEGYGHHPLRKDFPHQGIEPDRLYREWDRERRRAWDPKP